MFTHLVELCLNLYEQLPNNIIETHRLIVASIYTNIIHYVGTIRYKYFSTASFAFTDLRHIISYLKNKY